MATIEAAIYARAVSQSAITALIGTRFYPLHAPEDVAFPYSTYQVVSAGALDTVGGPTSTEHERYQFDHLTLDYDVVKTLARAFRAAFSGWDDRAGSPSITSFRLNEGGEQEDNEPPADGSDTWVYRVIQDYDVWYS